MKASLNGREAETAPLAGGADVVQRVLVGERKRTASEPYYDDPANRRDYRKAILTNRLADQRHKVDKWWEEQNRLEPEEKNSVPSYNDASMVRLLIFSGRGGLLEERQPVSSADRRRNGEQPHSDASYDRANPDDERRADRDRTPSHDAEVHLLKHVESRVFQAINGIKARRDGSDGSPADPTYSDEIRVEFIGPKGPCTDCYTAVQRRLAVYRRWMTHVGLDPTALRISVKSRYFGVKLLRGQRNPNFNHQSHDYGRADAKGEDRRKGVNLRVRHNKIDD